MKVTGKLIESNIQPIVMNGGFTLDIGFERLFNKWVFKEWLNEKSSNELKEQLKNRYPSAKIDHINGTATGIPMYKITLEFADEGDEAEFITTQNELEVTLTIKEK